MNVVKICVWMNIPSHHQHFFFEALNAREDVELTVRYYDRALLAFRQRQGWIAPEMESYARFAAAESIADPEMRDYIHIIPTFDARGGRQLAELAVRHRLRWCHWGERTGGGFAKLVGFNGFLFRWLYHPANRIRMRRQIALVRDHALVAYAQGKFAHDELKRWGIAESRIVFLPYSVSALPKVPASPEIANFVRGRIAFLCVASLCRLKGIIWLLRAYAALTDDLRARCCLVFVGSGDDTEYLKFCRRKGIADGVRFFGTRPSDQIAGVYNGCDCMVLPTLHDGWGVVLNEAASVGMPIISTTECGAAWHLIEPGVNGFRVPGKNWRKLAAALAFYVDHPGRIAEHGAASEKLFECVEPAHCAEHLISSLRVFGQ